MANQLLNYCLKKPYFKLMETYNDIYWAVKKTAVNFFMDTMCDEEVLEPALLREVTDMILNLKGNKVGTWAIN